MLGGRGGGDEREKEAPQGRDGPSQAAPGPSQGREVSLGWVVRILLPKDSEP